MRLVIAMDGPAASGKGTLARRLAKAYGLPHLDTGLLYRALGWAMLERGFSLDDPLAAAAVAASLDLRHMDVDRLRQKDCGEAASRVAVLPVAREALLSLQQDFASQPSGAVLDGRDIGSVIVPDAPIKIFVTATPEERARRRTRELLARGEDVLYARVLEDILKRDARDQNRAVAPLVKTDDAALLDTTELDIEAAYAEALRICEERGARLPSS